MILKYACFVETQTMEALLQKIRNVRFSMLIPR